jgi:hypothetical protein
MINTLSIAKKEGLMLSRQIEKFIEGQMKDE